MYFIYSQIVFLFEYYTGKALEEIASTLGITKLNLDFGDPCDFQKLKIDVAQDRTSENIIVCDCTLNNTCHITDL